MARQQARDNVVTVARPVADDQIDLVALVEIFNRGLGARGSREDARGAQQGNDSPRRELAPLTRPRSRSAPSPLVGEGRGGGSFGDAQARPASPRVTPRRRRTARGSPSAARCAEAA